MANESGRTFVPDFIRTRLPHRRWAREWIQSGSSRKGCTELLESGIRHDVTWEDLVLPRQISLGLRTSAG